MTRLALAGGALALCLACQGDDWIIAGELPREEAPPDSPLGTPEVIDDPSGCPSAADRLEQRAQAFSEPSLAPEYIGRWSGELDLDAPAGFPSRTLELLVGSDGGGTLRFGGSTLLVPPEADRGYLCEADAAGVVCGSASGFVAGFAYPIEGARSRDSVLSFSIVAADPWGAWCAQQQPVRWEDASQACGFGFGVLSPAVSSWSSSGCSRLADDGSRTIDCALMYALDYCDCGRDACFANFGRSVEVGLELTPSGSALRGSLWYEDEANAGWVVLSRVP